MHIPSAILRRSLETGDARIIVETLVRTTREMERVVLHVLPQGQYAVEASGINIRSATPFSEIDQCDPIRRDEEIAIGLLDDAFARQSTRVIEVVTTADFYETEVLPYIAKHRPLLLQRLIQEGK